MGSHWFDCPVQNMTLPNTTFEMVTDSFEGLCGEAVREDSATVTLNELPFLRDPAIGGNTTQKLPSEISAANVCCSDVPRLVRVSVTGPFFCDL
jgi:hypothetical protein